MGETVRTSRWNQEIGKESEIKKDQDIKSNKLTVHPCSNTPSLHLSQPQTGSLCPHVVFVAHVGEDKNLTGMTWGDYQKNRVSTIKRLLLEYAGMLLKELSYFK